MAAGRFWLGVVVHEDGQSAEAFFTDLSQRRTLSDSSSRKKSQRSGTWELDSDEESCMVGEGRLDSVVRDLCISLLQAIPSFLPFFSHPDLKSVDRI